MFFSLKHNLYTLIEMSPKCIPVGPGDNKSILVQVMA